METTPEDEYPHVPLEDCLWREGYHFNGYDPVNRLGVTISIGIKPVLGYREEIVAVHMKDPLVFLKLREIDGDNVLHLGTLKLELLDPLRKWRTTIKDSFQRTDHGIPSKLSEEVEFDLYFDSNISPHKYRTKKGERYEQPGFFEGEIRMGNDSLDFKGTGIRDHSWEIRDVASWGEWYGLMGWTELGMYLTVTYLKINNNFFWKGWLRTDDYHEIQNVQADPVFSGDVLEKYTMKVEAWREKMEFTSRVLSYFLIPAEEKGRKPVVETAVELEEGGYGFLWYGK